MPKVILNIISMFRSAYSFILNLISDHAALFWGFIMLMFLFICFFIMRIQGRSKFGAQRQVTIFDGIATFWESASLLVIPLVLINHLIQFTAKLSSVISPLLESLNTWISGTRFEIIARFFAILFNFLWKIFCCYLPVDIPLKKAVDSYFFPTFLYLLLFEICTKEAIRDSLIKSVRNTLKGIPFVSTILKKCKARILSVWKRFRDKWILKKVRTIFHDFIVVQNDEDPENLPKRYEILGVMYDYDPYLHRYFLKEEYKWYRYLMPVCILIILCLGGQGNYLYAYSDNTQTYNLMVFPLCLVADIWFATGLDTRQEFDEIRRMDPYNESKQVAALQKTAYNIKKLYNSFCHGEETIFSEMFQEHDLQSLSVEEEEELSQEEQLVKQYLADCHALHIEVDEKLAVPSRVLLCPKKGIVFATRFYQDIDYSFYLPMLRSLHNGCNCLIISGNDMSVEGITSLNDWLLRGLNRIISSSSIWRIKKMEKHIDNFEIGIMTSEDLSDAELLQKNQTFLSKVQFVLIINASALLHKQMYGIMNLRHIISPECSFAVCNDNAEGLQDIYSHLLHIDFDTIYPTTDSARWTRCLFFDASEEFCSEPTECRQIKLFETIRSNYAASVHWYSSGNRPIKDIKDRYGPIYGADEYASGQEQDGKLIFGIDDAVCPREKCACIIVEDDIRNPAELCHQFASRGKNGAIIAVFSYPYLLLNYIRENLTEFYKNARKISQWFPAYCMSERNVALQLIWIMERQHLTEEEISDICFSLGEPELFNRLKQGGNEINKQALAQLFESYTNTDIRTAEQCIQHGARHGEAEQEVLEYWLEGFPKNAYTRKEPCYYVGIDPNQKCPLPQYSIAQLHQLYLPEQNIALEGKRYIVKNIVDVDGTVIMFLQKNSQNIEWNTSYQQIRTVSFLENDCDNILTHHICGALQLDSFYADITVNTVSYWKLNGHRPIQNIALSLQQQNETRRSYKKKKALRVQLDSSVKDYKQIMQGLMLLFNELFCTIYAEYCAQLLVCASQSKPNAPTQTITAQNWVLTDELWNQESTGTFYIIEDSEEDIGLLDSIKKNFDTFLYMLNQYVEWSQK